jgi:4-hydroxy 2-oxovalerate aldolase
MDKYDLKLLDCTLRDGGYVNNWNWGFHTAKDVIQQLVKSKIDIVEVGFLRNINEYNPDITVCNSIEELNLLLPKNYNDTIFSAMAMQSTYDINKLSPYNGQGIELIRITAHDYDIVNGMDFALEVQKKGYKLSINPINIMGYSDERILWILKQVNEIQPYQFSIVDTFGSMKRRDLDRIISLVDNNLHKNIRVALHLHENMSLSCYLAQRFIDMHLKRPVSVDGSLMGIGRIPGNLPIELIADYLNDFTESNYDIDYLMDAIQDYISPIKGQISWGYTPAYFLSARFNLHRNYAEHYLEKGDLTNRDIHHILSRIDREKATAFDSAYADRLYDHYKSIHINDTADRARLLTEFQNQSILIIAPGASINTYHEQIMSFINAEKPIVISVNFVPDDYPIAYAFFSNNKRFDKLENVSSKLITTSNLSNLNSDFKIDYNSLTGAFRQGCNSLIMLLKLLKDMKVKHISVAGADGYKKNSCNYYSSNIRTYSEHGSNFNLAVRDAIAKLNLNLSFLTPSEYI